MRLINDRTTHESVKKEALAKIEEWVKEFGKRDEFGIMVETYEALKKQNHKFSSNRPATPVDPRSEDAMRREEEELQRALAESAQMADPRRGFVASQPPSSASGSKALPQHPPSNGYESGFRPPSRSSAIPDPRAQGRERRVRAIYDFEGGQGPDELPFAKGDVIRVLETVYADWWRGELRGREGIFPANRVEELPDVPTPAPAPAPAPVPSTDAEMEAELFAKSASIDQLLTMMRNVSARGESMADNDELADRYNEAMALAPKVVNLIRKYDQKQAELREMNDKFVKAKATYEQLAGYGHGGYPQAAPPPHHQQQQPPYGQHPPQHQQQPYYPQQQAPPPQPQHDPEQERREQEERERREYEEKYAQYEKELAAYNQEMARQAQQQQLYAQQQHPQPGQAPQADPATQQWQADPRQPPPDQHYPQDHAHGLPPPNGVPVAAPPASSDPRQGQSPPPGATQQWASVQAAQAQQAPPPLQAEPIWDGQQWIYPQQHAQVQPLHHEQQPAPISSPPPPAPQHAASPPPATAYTAPGSQAYPAQPYPDVQPPQQQQAPYAMAPSPVGSLGSPAAAYGLAEQMQHLSMDPSAHPQQQQQHVPPNVARYQLADRPLNATSPPPSTVPPQQSPNAAFSTLPQQASAQLYQPTVAAAVVGSPGPVASTQQQQQGEDDPQAAAEAWARYHREKEEYDNFMAQQAALQGGAPPPVA
ncbi:hypothetical protein BCR35DRAFT_308005 [Leucosporidium creatinivorum]|uniref:Class E vacuolar protein-sorting machinery protein HSE1 n=1 Tax=Leucosporidium creatinivorum TaxID=106004 RepID=A0A1Y2ECX9_9BASI|nr:hypothetical protein BCR35DRAFT_308005 [Leucosporidium creatinivorum]